MAEYAVVKGGMQRLAVIHSFEARSTDLAESFASSIRSLGAAVVAMEGYQRGATDFKDQILAVKAARPDGIYVPVDAWDAVQIAPQLRFYSLDLPLLGSSGWDDQMLTRLGGEYVDGAVFPVSCDAGSLYPPAARFNYFYRRQYGEEPSEVAAQAYDAAQILLSAWQRAGDDRAGIERALASMGVHVGATGRCTLGAAGDASRVQVPLMTVSEGEVLRLE
jgi:branched-chain amino acid transport system substrate-binding protein